MAVHPPIDIYPRYGTVKKVETQSATVDSTVEVCLSPISHTYTTANTSLGKRHPASNGGRLGERVLDSPDSGIFDLNSRMAVLQHHSSVVRAILALNMPNLNEDFSITDA